MGKKGARGFNIYQKSCRLVKRCWLQVDPPRGGLQDLEKMDPPLGGGVQDLSRIPGHEVTLNFCLGFLSMVAT